MFTHMSLVTAIKHHVRDMVYEILVYRVDETGQHRLYIARGGLGVGDVFTATDEAIPDAKQTVRPDIVAELISLAKNHIERNEFGLYQEHGGLKGRRP